MTKTCWRASFLPCNLAHATDDSLRAGRFHRLPFNPRRAWRRGNLRRLRPESSGHRPVHHGRGHESLAIEGAARRGEEAFREEIYGTNFHVTVPNLPAGKYTADHRPRGSGFSRTPASARSTSPAATRRSPATSTFLPPPAARERFSCSRTGLISPAMHRAGR